MEADGQSRLPSLQVLKEFVSNLERDKAFGNSQFRAGNQQGVTTRLLVFWATNAHGPQPSALLIVLQQVIQQK